MSTQEVKEVRAAAKWVRITPRKARLVVEHIRGRSVPEARTMLAFTERAATQIKKRMCHITITLGPASTATVTRAPEPEAPAEEKPKAAPRRKAAQAAPNADAETKPEAEKKPAAKKPAARKRAPAKKKTEEKES